MKKANQGCAGITFGPGLLHLPPVQDCEQELGHSEDKSDDQGDNCFGRELSHCDQVQQRAVSMKILRPEQWWSRKWKDAGCFGLEALFISDSYEVMLYLQKAQEMKI